MLCDPELALGELSGWTKYQGAWQRFSSLNSALQFCVFNSGSPIYSSSSYTKFNRPLRWKWYLGKWTCSGYTFNSVAFCARLSPLSIPKKLSGFFLSIHSRFNLGIFPPPHYPYSTVLGCSVSFYVGSTDG